MPDHKEVLYKDMYNMLCAACGTIIEVNNPKDRERHKEECHGFKAIAPFLDEIITQGHGQGRANKLNRMANKMMAKGELIRLYAKAVVDEEGENRIKSMENRMRAGIWTGNPNEFTPLVGIPEGEELTEELIEKHIWFYFGELLYAEKKEIEELLNG